MKHPTFVGGDRRRIVRQTYGLLLRARRQRPRCRRTSEKRDELPAPHAHSPEPERAMVTVRAGLLEGVGPAVPAAPADGPHLHPLQASCRGSTKELARARRLCYYL